MSAQRVVELGQVAVRDAAVKLAEGLRRGVGGAVLARIENSMLGVLVSYVFFFASRRRHTRLQGDWSSDVCSSDLAAPGICQPCHNGEDKTDKGAAAALAMRGGMERLKGEIDRSDALLAHLKNAEIGRASCRERV